MGLVFIVPLVLILGVLGGLAMQVSGPLLQGWTNRELDERADLVSKALHGAIMLSLGWRSAWIGLGLLIWCVAVPPMFFLRRSPEEMGLLPDGAQPEAAAAPGASTGAGADAAVPVRRGEISFTLRQALRTRSFYLMTIGQTTLALVISGLHFHWFAYMASRGLLEKLGFTYEGFARGYLRINGVWADHRLYAILREEWRPWRA